MRVKHIKSPAAIKSWRIAQAQGQKQFGGDICNLCNHPLAMWYTLKGQCVECVRIKSAESKRRNKGENIAYRECPCPKCGGNRWYIKADKCVDCYEKIVTKRTATKRANIAATLTPITIDMDIMAMILAKPWRYWSSSQVSTTL